VDSAFPEIGPSAGSLSHTSPALRWVSYAAVAATYALVIMGAVVRASGSGLGCPDWPLCYGQIVPPGHAPSIIEWSHRLLGAVASSFIVATVVLWARANRWNRKVVSAGLGLGALLLAQILLGAVTVKLELPPFVVMAHLGMAMLLLGALVIIAVIATPFANADPSHPVAEGAAASRAGFRRLALSAVGAVYTLILVGAWVRATGATWACFGFPTCNGEILPFGSGPLVDLHLFHRLLAYAVSAHLIVTVARAWRTERQSSTICAAATAMGGWLLTQIAIGASMVSMGIPPLAQVLHVAGAGGLWISTVTLAAVAFRAPERRAESTSLPVESTGSRSDGRAARSTFTAYLNLTKPRIIVLLLATTFAAMLMAAGGMPPWHTILFTMVGGALGAGAANAVNCCIDRDIDALMKRTSVRSIPAGAVKPEAALRFGLILAAASFIVLTVWVNPLSAVLTLAAFAFYVLVYTRWLKRSTVHNIVIGGAAGAVPPLVGWAAVTGNISLLAVYLFAIIFFWTPPHFWALALLIQRDYAAAGVPMLPVVKGEAETRRQILLYTVLLAALTLSVVAFGLLGQIYLAAAIILGGFFLAFAIQLMRQTSDKAARRLFRYSLLYLPLLFGAMVVDRLV